MKAIRLDWDSSFFGKEVFKIIENEPDEIQKKISSLSPGSMVYLFTGTTILSSDFCSMYDCKHVDTKVIFEKTLSEASEIVAEFEVYSESKITQALVNLALESGKYSRFKLDSRIPDVKFKELYSLWIENSVKDEGTTVLIHSSKQKIDGFVTLTLKGNYGQIGLIATDKKVRGKGIGGRLIQLCEKKLIEDKINRIRIPTQKQNQRAVNFYSKLGYKMISEENIYHILK